MDGITMTSQDGPKKKREKKQEREGPDKDLFFSCHASNAV